MKMDILFYIVFHNKYLKNKIFSFFPSYQFNQNSTKCTGSSNWIKNEVVITPNYTSQVGGCWANRPVLFNQNLKISFGFKMDSQGSDGIAVVFLKEPFNKSNGQVCFNGSDLGYNGFINGIFAIEFDVYKNIDVGDPDANHISIQSVDNNIIEPKLSTHSSSTLFTVKPSVEMKNGEVHTVKIRYNNKNKSISLNFNGKQLIPYTEIPQFKNGSKPIERVYIGITGATGIKNPQVQTIYNILIYKQERGSNY